MGIGVKQKTTQFRELSLNPERQNRFERYHFNKHRGQEPENAPDLMRWSNVRPKVLPFYEKLGLKNIDIKNIGNDLGQHNHLDHYDGVPLISNTILAKSKELRKMNGDTLPGSVYSIDSINAEPKGDPRYYTLKVKGIPFYVSEAIQAIAKETGQPTTEDFGLLISESLVKVKIANQDHLAFALHTPHNPNGIESASPNYAIHVGQQLTRFGDLIADELEFRFNYEIGYPSKIFAVSGLTYTAKPSIGFHFMTRIGTGYEKKEDVTWIGSGDLYLVPLQINSIAKFLAKNVKKFNQDLKSFKPELRMSVFAYALKEFGVNFLDVLEKELNKD